MQHSVIVRGILEEYKETEQMIVDKLHSALSPIMQGETEQEKLKNAKEITFTSCRRLGRFSRNRICPLSVELQHKQDVEFILDNCFDLKQGIYVDKEYPANVERKQKTLLPVLRAAKLLDDYKKQSRLEDNKIVLKGRSYTVNTLNQLPEELNAFKVTSRENETTVGFFGEINPLSNFYPSPFLYNGIRYVSSEQFIQSSKAKYFGDHDAYNQILGCSTSLECKTISRQIRNVNERKWEDVAGNICHPGIRAKFLQNSYAMETLLYRTRTKQIVESASDRLWGTGLTLSDSSCLDSTKWVSHGLLGQILESIRKKANSSTSQAAFTLPPPSHVTKSQKYQPGTTRHQPDNGEGISATNSSSNHLDNAFVVSKPKPIPTAACTYEMLESTTVNSDGASTSVSTTPISDTTASDTDQNEVPSQGQSELVGGDNLIVME